MRSWLPILIAVALCGPVSAQIVQNYDLRAITRTDGVIPVGDGSKFVGESGATARTSLGLGTIATQAASSVAITGGTIDGTTIGGTTMAAGAFTTLTTTDNVGIGTTATNRLTVDYSNNSSATAGIKLNSSYPTTGQTVIGLYIRDALKGKIRADSLGNLAFESQGGTIDYNYTGGGTGVVFWNGAGGLLVKFKQTGEVGLGVSNPTSKLEIGADNAKLALGAAGATDSYLQWTGSNLEVYSAGMVDIAAPLSITPGSSVTPANNGDVTFELTNNTTLTVKAKGSDGTVRTVALTLAP